MVTCSPPLMASSSTVVTSSSDRRRKGEADGAVNYFVDESGQTGDIARLNALSGFSDQPIFCLAAIGVARRKGALQ